MSMKGPELHLRTPVYIVWSFKCPAALKYHLNNNFHCFLGGKVSFREVTWFVPVRMAEPEIILHPLIWVYCSELVLVSYYLLLLHVYVSLLLPEPMDPLY